MDKEDCNDKTKGQINNKLKNGKKESIASKLPPLPGQKKSKTNSNKMSSSKSGLGNEPGGNVKLDKLISSSSKGTETKGKNNPAKLSKSAGNTGKKEAEKMGKMTPNKMK